MRRASASERFARRARAAAVALSIAGGYGLLCGFATGAAADPGAEPAGGGAGDGSLQLIPEVIANGGVSAGRSGDFPITSRLFLPALDERARQEERSRADVAHAAEKLTFERVGSASADDAYAETRSRLFQDYSHQDLPGARRESAAQGTDVWVVVIIAAAVPLAGLAAFLGLKLAARRGNRHA